MEDYCTELTCWNLNPCYHQACDDTSVTLVPYFTVPSENLEKVRELAGRFVEKTHQETKVLYYGFTLHGNQMMCREGYADYHGVLQHLQNVDAELKELLTLASVDRIEVHGAESQLAPLREPLSGLNPVYYLLECGFARSIPYAHTTWQVGPAADTAVSIHPYFDIPEQNLAAFKALAAEFVNRTRDESKALFYGFTFAGNKAFCRESYVDGAAALFHHNHMHDLLVRAGAISTVEVQLHGRADELRAFAAAGFPDSVFWNLEIGFRR